MTAKGYFVTGTDTGVGKTRVTTGLIAGFQQLQARVLAMKPVACGYSVHDSRSINDDVLEIAALTGQNTDDPRLCTYSLAEPISPNIAANNAGISIELRRITDYFLQLTGISDVVIVEGAGGWQVPISETQTMADLATALGLPVILTVGLRLGCLNHALLTATAIRHSGLPLAGWVANLLDPTLLATSANIDTLTRYLGQPPLAVLPHDTANHSSRQLLLAAARTLRSRS
jgi:dethiobiotin synthetase